MKTWIEHARYLGQLKDQTYESGVIEEREEAQAKGIKSIFNKNNSRKRPQSWGREGHSGTGGF
jgi:hypothetical protein